MKTSNLACYIARFWPGKTSAPAPATPGQTAPPAAPPLLGYTLIELIAALALLAILASMLVPVVVSQTETAAVNAETTSLSTLNNALVFQVQHNFQIPGSNNWATALGQWLGMPTTSITTNARGYQRIYVYDTNGFGSMTLPYTQINGLASLPANPRIMIVTSVSTNVPDISGPLSTTEFNAVWNTLPGNIPATWTTNWHGKAADLLIQRINLLPLFSQVVLSAVDTNIFGNFVVQSGTISSYPIYVLTNSPSTNWYLQGTVLALYDTNNPPVQKLESQYVVHSANSWVFEDQAWRGELMGWGTNGPAGWISSTTIYTNTSSIQISQTYVTCQKTFKTCATDSNDWNASYHGDCCQAVSDCFDSFILHYNSWCNQGFATGGNSACNQLSQDLNQVNSITGNMCQ